MKPVEGFPAAVDLQDLIAQSSVAASRYFSKHFSDTHDLAASKKFSDTRDLIECTHPPVAEKVDQVVCFHEETQFCKVPPQAEGSRLVEDICDPEKLQHSDNVVRNESVFGLEYREMPHHTEQTDITSSKLHFQRRKKFEVETSFITEEDSASSLIREPKMKSRE